MQFVGIAPLEQDFPSLLPPRLLYTAKVEAVRRLPRRLRAAGGAKRMECVELAPAFRTNPQHQKRRRADAFSREAGLPAVWWRLRCAVFQRTAPPFEEVAIRGKWQIWPAGPEHALGRIRFAFTGECRKLGR